MKFKKVVSWKNKLMVGFMFEASSAPSPRLFNEQPLRLKVSLLSLSMPPLMKHNLC